MLELNTIHKTDCLIGMQDLPDKSVDMVLSDLPYGILDCKWDKPLDLTLFWGQINRIIKDNGAIVLTATMKFAIDLINSNKRYFRYDLNWSKTMSVGHANCNRMPMRSHELILLFYKKLPTYNPQGLIPTKNQKIQHKYSSDREHTYKTESLSNPYTKRFTNYPRSVLTFQNNNSKNVHPTQKPLDMFKYLIQTYSNPGDLILDTCMGSGTTAIAALETERCFVGFETDERYFELATKRVAAWKSG